MTFSFKDRFSKFKTFFLPAKSILAVYLVWCLISAVLFYLGLHFPPENPLATQLLEMISVVGFILLASSLTMFYMIHIEPHLKENTPRRVIWLLAVISLFITGYTLASHTGNEIMIIAWFSTANLIIFASLIGNWMTAPLTRPAELVPLCVVVAFSDLFSVVAGPTRYLAERIEGYYNGGMQGAPPFIDFLLVKIVAPGLEIPMPIFGISDWIIVAFLAAATRKFNMDDNLIKTSAKGIKKVPVLFYFPITSAGLLISILIARLTNVFIPALPFVIVLFLGFMMVKYPEMRKLTKAELIPTFIFPSILMILTFSI